MNCPCGASGEQLVQYFPAGETDFRLCKVCGCVFREQFPGPEELDEIYRLAYEEENISGETTNQESGDYAVRSFADFLAGRIVKPGERILDYGAGSGVLVSELRNRGLACDGFEFAESAREYCLANRGYSLKSNLQAVPDGYYQAVTMIEVIEHLTDLTNTLKEIYRVLAPGGKLFITTPSRGGFRARIEKGNWREARKKFHLFLFDWRSISFHLKRAGFADVEHIVFSPFQKEGWKFVLYARIMQAIGMSGTLCVLASRQ
jgi:SAM-dependent methyltransferase